MGFQFPTLHLDANESAFLSRQLEHVRAQSFDILFPELKGRRMVPVDNSVDPGAETIRYAQYESVGSAEMAKDYGEDAPTADVKSGEFTHGVFGMKVKYSYSLQEIRAARLAGLPLDARKGAAARRAIEQLFDEIIWLGHAATGLKGLLNQSSTCTYTTPVGGNGSKLWSLKSPDEILVDMFGMEATIRETTKEVEAPDTLVLPLSSHGIVTTRRLGDGSDTTILKHFLANALSIKNVEFSHKLESNAGWTGKRMVSYRRSPDKLQAIIPQEFSQLPPQARGYQIVTFCEGRCGGVELYYPKSMCYGDEI